MKAARSDSTSLRNDRLISERNRERRTTFVVMKSVRRLRERVYWDAEIEGRPIPEGWAVDPQGRPTTDATAALKGAVLPFGAHKGFGIALMVDVFCGVLSGAAFSNRVGQLWGNKETVQDLGMYFAAVNPDATVGREAFVDRVDSLIEDLKACEPAVGHDAVRVPGEIEFEQTARNREDGICVGPGVLTELTELSRFYSIEMDIRR